ncbi:MAG: hypothetical protein HWD82_07305 [Flavobacteriaceae bacterium]|nr:hypothetical protein [Flavobacteriaceae bacterium]
MSTLKNKKADFTATFKSTVNKVKANAKKANDTALKTTEDVVTETINIASEWQKVTDKALKGGIKLLDNQQNIVFNTLEAYKNHFVNGSKRLRKVFS